eukprot:243826-Chlamydomonas_euryale.AAC.2
MLVAHGLPLSTAEGSVRPSSRMTSTPPPYNPHTSNTHCPATARSLPAAKLGSQQRASLLPARRSAPCQTFALKPHSPRQSCSWAAGLRFHPGACVYP